MIREPLMARHTPRPTDFRWRGGSVSRLEGFSDAVFGFALTLLVVSLQVPRTFDDLVATMRGFLGFAICFCVLSLVWYDHYLFFRQYGLHDTWTVVLNLVLLFVVFYVCPLKFLFTLLVTIGFRHSSGAGPVIRGDQWPSLMIIYGAGFVAVYLVFTLMYLNAYRQRASLDLNELERFDTRATIGCNLVLMSIGVTSMVLASFRTPQSAIAAGLTYWFTGIAMGVYWRIAGRRRRKLEQKHTDEHAEPVPEE